MNIKSSEVILLVAFKAHRIKDISRPQLAGAARKYCTADVMKTLKGADKSQYLIPVAVALVKKNIIKVNSQG